MTTAPILTGRDIAEAEGAVQAMLEAALAGSGLSADHFVALNILRARPGMTGDEFAAFLLSQRQLRLDGERARLVAVGLASAGLIESPRADEPIVVSHHGEAVHREQLGVVQDVVGRLYGEIDDAELTVAKDVLARIGVRAAEITARLTPQA